MLNVEMLSTGEEVLHGQIVDTNAAWLADYFFQHGIPMVARSTVGDDLARLVTTLQLRSQYADILIVNGGLGPTSDDLSALAAATALNEPLVERPEWVAQMRSYFAERKRVMADSNLKQAQLPASAELLNNPVGTACGFSIRLNDCYIYFTPGVPHEFKQMVEQQIMPRLRQNFQLPPPPVCLRLTSFGRSESGLAQHLDKLKLPEEVTLGYRSSMPIIELKLTGPERCYLPMLSVWQQIKQYVGENAVFEGALGLPFILAEQLQQQSLTLALSEQVTAGWLTWQLNSAQTALTGSEIIPTSNNCSLQELASRAREIATERQAVLGLATGGFQAGHFMLALATPTGTIALRVHYQANSYSEQTTQQVVAMFALDVLRRWLNQWPIVGNYEWLKVVEQVTC